MGRKIDRVGLKYHKLLVLSEHGKKGIGQNAKTTWLCKCDCGNTTIVSGDSLVTGGIKSCGCLKIHTSLTSCLTHGEAGKYSKTKEYNTWCAIKRRCHYEGDISYPNYGGRGISMCKRWFDSYESFIEDMGRAPDKTYSIDRIDNDGNYELSNCKWATKKEQSNNRRSCVLYELDGVTKNIKQWAAELGCTYSYVNDRRYRHNESIADIAKRFNYQPLKRDAYIPPRRKKAALLEHNGLSMKISEWAKALGTSYVCLYDNVVKRGKNLAQVIQERNLKLAT